MPELNTTGSNKRPEDLSNIERSSSYSGEKTSFTEQSISDNRPALRFGALKPALNYSSQELAQIAGLEKFNSRTHALLAGYFQRRLKITERRELAGLLVFPANKDGQKLFSESLKRKLSEKKLMLLTSCALSPYSERGATLHAIKLAGKRELSLTERAELYGTQVYPQSPEQARELSRALHHTLKQVFSGNLSTDQIYQEIKRFVREELKRESDHVSSDSEIGALFSLGAKTVKAILEDPKHGLGEQERVYRAEKLTLSQEHEKFALSIQRRRGIANFVAIENHMHRNGLIDRLSSSSEIAELFGITIPEARKSLRLIPHPEREYRVSQSGDDELLEKKQRVASLITEELEAYRSGQVKKLSTDSEIAELFAILPVTVAQIARQFLTEADQEYRRYILRERGRIEAHRESVVAYVREELKAFDKAEITQLTDDKKLAEIFRISPETVKRELFSENNGLSAPEKKFRHYVFSSQYPSEPTAEALRQVIVHAIGDSVERHLIKELSNSENRKNGQSSAEMIEKRKSRSVVFKGKHFDSYEEAVCGIMMERYIPGFTLKEGETFQISVGDNRIDFSVNNVAVEYHPILLFKRGNLGEFKSYEEYRMFREIRDSLPPKERAAYIEGMKEILAERYKEERQELLSRHKDLGLDEVVVARSPESFYYSVIKRFGSRVPTREIFLKEFRKMLAKVKVENIDPQSPEGRRQQFRIVTRAA